MRVAVIGLGLIGGSIALRCVRRGQRVIGYDVAAETRAAAGLRFPVADSLADAVVDADLIVLAVPLVAMESIVQALAAVMADSHAIIVDVGSVKAPVRATLEAAGLGARYVGLHPMAGNEHSGFAFADPMLLVGATWVLTSADKPAEQSRGFETAFHASSTDGDTPRHSLQVGQVVHYSEGRMGNEVYRWVTDTFDAKVIEMSDRDHDQAQALISGLPHVFAVELLNLLTDAGGGDAASGSQKTSPGNLAQQMAAGSFRDSTRVGYTDPDRTMALITQNASNIVPLLRKAVADLTALADQLESTTDPKTFFHHADPLRGSIISPASQNNNAAPRGVAVGDRL